MCCITTPNVQEPFQKKGKKEFKNLQWWITTGKHLDTGQLKY